MRVCIVAAGSRGDVQPLIALGLGLQAAGHDVTLCAGGNYAPLAAQHGLPFRPFGVDVDEVMRSDLGRQWLGGSSDNPFQELRLLTTLVRRWAPQMAAEVLELVGTADLFVSGIMTVDAVDLIARESRARHWVALMSPYHPTTAGWATLHAIRPQSLSRLNRQQARLVLWLASGAFGAPGAEVRRVLRREARYRRDYLRALTRTPAVLAISPIVLPRPKDWPEHVHLSGTWSLPTPVGWEPPTGLVEFLDGGEPPVYVGFGSMSTQDADGTLDAIVAGLARSGRRGVVHRGGADLGRDQLPAEVLLVDDVPHGWLFPRTAAVIHHGGAGTTAAALRAGVPSAAVTHIGDQPYWGRRVAELGVGARPIRRHRLTGDRLAAMIDALVDRPPKAARAADLGRRLRDEDGVGTAVQRLEH